MSDALACVLILGLAFGYLGVFQLARRLFEHELRLEDLEAAGTDRPGRPAVVPVPIPVPVELRIADTPDGPDLAA